MIWAPLVFVSSTKEDLDLYRVEVAAKLLRLDALYRGMELFPSQPSRPKSIMLEEVRKCDLFVGVLGHRYGSVDPDTKLSYTQLEYQEAIRQVKHVCIFVIGDSVAVDVRALEDDERRRKLAEFKREVLASHGCEQFTTPAELAGKVADAIRKWIGENETVHTEMRVAATLPAVADRRNIRALYSGNERAIVSASESLANSGTRQPLEHYYALLHTRKDSEAIRHAILRALIALPPECVRVEQILEDMIEDQEPVLRRGAAYVIGERARPPTGKVGTHVTRLMLARTSDENDLVRDEVAHALPKVACKHPELWKQCQIALEQMATEDPSTSVRGRAQTSLADMRQSLPGPTARCESGAER